jgi:formylglycine-generating enzyme required for sulfatase activity
VRENIEFVLKYHKEADATQIAEVLWLSQFLPKEERKEKTFLKKDTPSAKEVTEHLPREVVHIIVISKKRDVSSTKNTAPQKKYGVIRNKNSSSSYGAKIEYKSTHFSVKEQFSSLRIKQKRVSLKEIDEVKSADYIANTGIFNPIFKLEKFYEPYFNLNILIDTNESMFLWQESIKHFVEELKYSNYFREVRHFNFNSGQEQVVFKNRAILQQEKVLNLVFTDTVGRAWRNNRMFLLLDEFSKTSFTAIVSMLPKQMWQRTSLREGESRFMKNRKFPPTNKSLKAEYDFIEKSFSKSSIKIPVIPYDETAFEYLSKVILATKGSLIDTRIFEDLEPIGLEDENRALDAITRVKRFFNSAQPKTKELAIYCSVLPLNNEIIKEVICRKQLGNVDAFAEFYFGGLLDKSKKVELGVYEFYDGVQRELLQYISIEVAKELWEILREVIPQSLGVRFGFIELLNEVDSGEVLDEKERAIVDLLIKILAEKGVFYQKDIDKLNSLIDMDEVKNDKNTIYLETNTYQMGSNDGYSDEKPIHTITFDYDFEIAKTPVTFEEYDLYCEDTKREKPSDEGWGRGKRPVINVSWEDAVAYCAWLSKKTGKEYRLPTEAEWEYACRAGTTMKWSFGDDESELEHYAWYDKNSNRKTHEVATKKENPWGLFDMHGNVWEWCLDDWVDNYHETPRDGTANKISKDSRKVVRGGSWFNFANYTRSAYRSNGTPTNRSFNVGFRLLRTLP